MTQLTTINFPNTPMFILYLCFLTVCMWGAKKGWESIGSIAWAVFPYLMIALGLLFILMLKESQFNRIFPLFGTGMLEVTKASFRFTPLFAELFYLAMMYPLVKSHQTYTKSIFTSLLFSMCLMVLMYLSYLWMFDYRSVEKITYPFNEVIRFISLGRYITNVETFFIAIWLVAVVIKFTVYIYIVCKIFGFLFQINEFEHCILPITLLILIIAMIPENNEINMFVIRSFVSTYYKYFLLLLPPLLWGVSKIKEGRSE